MPPFIDRVIQWWKRPHPRRKLKFAAVLVVLASLFIGTFLFFHVRYSRMIAERLSHGSLRTNSGIYAAPRLVSTGDEATPAQLIGHLQRAGYTEAADNGVGFYRRTQTGIEVTNGPESYFEPQTTRIEFDGGRVKRIISGADGKQSERFSLEPELITNVLDEARGKRRPVAFSEFPKHLIDAVISTEDKRFFTHNGLDLLRVAKAAYVDLKEGRKEQGASTLTMQLARSFWLEQDKTWGRKLSEVIIAGELERKFTKEQIFELYGNEVYLGRSGSFAVHGFGEAARTYFNKDVRALTLPEAAMLAGIIQRPSYYNPFRFPDRVKQRRNIVLTMMHTNGYIDAAQLTQASKAPIELKPSETETSDAPYFIDLVNEDLQNRFQDWDFDQSAYRIFSTLDLDLQRIAVESVQSAMVQVDKAARRAGGKKVANKVPQVALVAMDPHTGAIKALVGGRNYDRSQLNRVLAKRPPGSTFKPFVYAAALNARAQNKNGVTAGTSVMDEPTRFVFNKQFYEPTNFGGEYVGPVTVRNAVMQSMNIPTIKVAEIVGYQKVVDLANAAGITQPLQATPSLALGAYEVPPIELAEAYTIFPNQGVHVKRQWIDSIRDAKNRPVYRPKPEQNQALDPRAAYIMTNILEDVVRAGTAGSVRGRGFKPPAGGKTGTAHDGWFAGFTDNLITVVWIGYDDYTELGLEGAKSALPVWTEFMKRAHTLKQYANPKPFKAPAGIVRAEIDGDTGFLVGAECVNVRTEMFIAGTQPKEICIDDHSYLYKDELLTEVSEPDKPRRTFARKVLDIFR